MKSVMILGYGHKYEDKRVYLKSVLALSEVFDKVYYVVHQKRPYGLDVPSNVKDILIENFPIRTLKRSKEYDPVFWKILFDFEKNIDLLYIHDVPGYVFPAQKVKKMKRLNKCKVILDLHEYIPDTVFPSMPSNLLKNNINKFLYEKPLIKAADGIVAVCDFVRNSALKYGKNPNTTFNLPNYAHHQLKVKNYDNRENAIAFVGKMKSGNGPENIERFIRKSLPDNWIFYFIGSDTNNLKTLGFSEETLKNGKVKALGMLSYDKMMDKISEVKFTLSHMHPNKINVVYSLPNKFYDSIAAGTPVLVINELIEQRNVIKKNGTGITFDLNESLTVSKKISTILSDEMLYQKIISDIQKNQKYFIWETAKTSYQNFIRKFIV